MRRRNLGQSLINIGSGLLLMGLMSIISFILIFDSSDGETRFIYAVLSAVFGFLFFVGILLILTGNNIVQKRSKIKIRVLALLKNNNNIKIERIAYLVNIDEKEALRLVADCITANKVKGYVNPQSMTFHKRMESYGSDMLPDFVDLSIDVHSGGEPDFHVEDQDRVNRIIKNIKKTNGTDDTSSTTDIDEILREMEMEEQLKERHRLAIEEKNLLEMPAKASDDVPEPKKIRSLKERPSLRKRVKGKRKRARGGKKRKKGKKIVKLEKAPAEAYNGQRLCKNCHVELIHDPTRDNYECPMCSLVQ
jgi:predicted transcriptional regulator